MNVIIGAGNQRYDGWVATQQHELDLLSPPSFEKFFGVRLADSLLCEHTWEHLTFEEGVNAAKLCWSYLRVGGRLRVAVPDGHFPDENYQRTIQVGGPGPNDHPAAGHKIVYVADTLSAVFTHAGFVVRLLEWWDSNNQFHVSEWSLDDGPIYRSTLLDHRNENYRTGHGALGYSSLIIDALKN
jgi:predicted SAM-dependent methyltransferase